MEYVKDFGQTTTNNYPYMAVNQDCKTQTGNFRIFGVAEGVGCREIEGIMSRNPVAVRVDASNWHSYESGIFDNCGTTLNHAVFMIGTSD